MIQISFAFLTSIPCASTSRKQSDCARPSDLQAPHYVRTPYNIQDKAHGELHASIIILAMLPSIYSPASDC